MKTSNLTFAEGFLGTRAQDAKAKGAISLAFDWDKAGRIIKEKFKTNSDLVAEAGLKGDWDYTGGEIFKDAKPTNDSYTYLQSNWATPTLILSCNGELEEIECWIEANDRFTSDTKWDDTSLNILEIPLM
jgi:hypothetical protein